MIHVAVIEDHHVVRAGFVQLIQASAGMTVVGDAGSADAALTMLRSVQCDVVLLDVSLPGAPVLQTIANIRSEHPDTAILIVSMHPEEQYAVDLIRAGARGYFPKAQKGEQLLRAIETVASGRRYL